jgi:mRNA-degrading endonuclease RelE of RelBE toxin-antitoxin system
MRVLLTPAAQEGLESLKPPMHGRVLRILERLERWPNVSGAKPLKGDLAGKFRLRTGDYRVQIQPVGNDVLVERIGHRDGFYVE